MEGLAEGFDLEGRTFALEVAFAEVRLAEGEVDEFAAGFEDAEGFGDFSVAVVYDLFWGILGASM